MKGKESKVKFLIGTWKKRAIHGLSKLTTVHHLIVPLPIVVTEWATGEKDYGDYLEGKIHGKRTVY